MPHTYHDIKEWLTIQIIRDTMGGGGRGEGGGRVLKFHVYIFGFQNSDFKAFASFLTCKKAKIGFERHFLPASFQSSMPTST